MCPAARAVTVYNPPRLFHPPPLLPLIRGRYGRTCTSLLRYKVSFHLLTQVTGFPCIQHRGKRTHWGWIDYLRGGCSLSTQHREGWQAVGVFIYLFFIKTLFGYKKKKFSIDCSSLFMKHFSDRNYDITGNRNRFHVIITNWNRIQIKAFCPQLHFVCSFSSKWRCIRNGVLAVHRIVLDSLLMSWQRDGERYIEGSHDVWPETWPSWIMMLYLKLTAHKLGLFRANIRWKLNNQKYKIHFFL